MFMGDQDGREFARFEPASGKAEGQLLRAKTGIDEKGGRLRPDERGIPIAATGQNRDLKHPWRMGAERTRCEIYPQPSDRPCLHSGCHIGLHRWRLRVRRLLLRRLRLSLAAL